MSKNKIHEERIRRIFIEAAKGILKSEGIQALSARNAADQAGYSYATVYNYFKDMKDLIFICLTEFQQEILDYVKDEADYTQCCGSRDRMKQSLQSLTKYFIQYPGIYDLLFLEKTREIRIFRETTNPVVLLIQDLLKEDWQAYREEKVLSEKDAQIFFDRILYSYSGLLLLFMNRFYPGDYSSFIVKMEEQLRVLFP